jgi:pSer/pThr/pTyr-binding forkhead associated (FHA) protein
MTIDLLTAHLLSVEIGGEVLDIPLAAEVTRLGRGVAADVNLDQPTVSRRHALIVQRNGETILLDDRSMNGTWLNGERINEAPLNDGDVIQLGAVSMRFLSRPA